MADVLDRYAVQVTQCQVRTAEHFINRLKAFAAYSLAAATHRGLVWVVLVFFLSLFVFFLFIPSFQQ